MANCLDNYGLDFFYENEETYGNLIGYVVHEGKAINGYYECPHLFLPVGNPEFWVSTSRKADGNFSVDTLNSHSGNHYIWKVASTGIDISPKDSPKIQKTYMFKSATDGKGFFPIEIITADVLPSYLENEVINVQVEALPSFIEYYKDEDDYAAHQPASTRGNKYMVAPGSLFPGGFLYNHDPDRDEKEKDLNADAHVLFAGKVKALYNGVFKLGDNSNRTYIRCIIDTQFGELELAHTYEQVAEELRENINVGAIVYGTCIISGDVAINEYENGIVKNHENNLHLLRDVFIVGEQERLNAVLTDDAEYLSPGSDKYLQGQDDIIDWLEYVKNHREGKTFAHLATITEFDGDEEDEEFPIGTRCIVLAYDEEHKYDSIVFVTTNDEGMIDQICILPDSRYHFTLDTPDWENELDDIMSPPDSIEPQMVARAKFSLNILDKNFNKDDLFANCSGIISFEENADNCIALLQDFSPKKDNLPIRNLFGYLFAKAIESEWNQENSPNEDPRLIVSHNLYDAFSGNYSSVLPEEENKLLLRAVELGKAFSLDYRSFINLRQETSDNYPKILKKALVVVQQLGKLYAAQLMEHPESMQE